HSSDDIYVGSGHHLVVRGDYCPLPWDRTRYSKQESMSRTQHTNFSADERSPWLTTRFKPLVTSLIAVDVLLVVVAIVVAVNVFGQGETPPPSPTAQPSQSAPSDPVEQTSDDASAAAEDLEVSG